MEKVDYSKFAKVVVVGQVSVGKTTATSSLGINPGNTGLKRTTMSPQISIFYGNKSGRRPTGSESIPLSEKAQILQELGIPKENFNWTNIKAAQNIFGLENLIIVDLPGFDDSKSNDEFMGAALSMLPKIDYVVCVSTITSFSSNSFLTHLNKFKEAADKHKFEGHFIDFLYLVNKIDDFGDLQSEECVLDIIDNYGKTYNLELGVNIFAYSASLHMMYCYNMLSQMGSFPLTITSQTNLCEMRTHLIRAGANKTKAFAKVDKVMSSITKAKREKKALIWKDVDLNTKDFAGEMLNISERHPGSEEGPNNGDHQGFLPRLGSLYAELPSKKYECELAYAARVTSESIAKVDNDLANFSEFKRALAKIKDFKIKSDGNILKSISNKLNGTTFINIYMSVCVTLEKMAFSYGEKRNMFSIFEPKNIPNGTLDKKVASIVAGDFKHHTIFLEALADPAFWNAKHKICTDQTYFNFFKNRLMEINDNNAKYCLEVMNLGLRTSNELYAIMYDSPEYISEVCKSLNRPFSWLCAMLTANCDHMRLQTVADGPGYMPLQHIIFNITSPYRLHAEVPGLNIKALRFGR